MNGSNLSDLGRRMLFRGDSFRAPESTPPQRVSDVDESSLRGGGNEGTGGGGWNKLPPEAKAECTKLISEIPGYTRAKYVKNYFEGGE